MASTVTQGHAGSSSGAGGLRERALLILAASLCFAALWLFFNWPAVSAEWWAMDDYTFLSSLHSLSLTDMFWNSLQAGRPLITLTWILRKIITAALPSIESANIAMRLLQGGIHVAIATMIGVTLARSTGSRLAYWTALPFLLWPFGGEATYWLPAIIYPVAGLLSLTGVLLCMRPKATRMLCSFGIGLIICATLTNQSGCLLGLAVLWMCMLLSVQEKGWWQRYRIPLRSIIPSYVIGAGISVALCFALGELRVTMASPPSLHALWFLFRFSLRFLLFEPYMYPLWMRVFQGAMVIIPVLVLIVTAFATRPAPNAFRFTGTLLFGMLVLVILPCIPLFLVSLEWLAGRLMYSAPLLFSTSLCMIFQWRLSPRKTNAIVLFLLIGLLASYFPISRTYAEEHVTVFRNDLRTLRELEAIAAREGVSEVAVATNPEREPMPNPYQLRYSGFGDSETSAFREVWSTNFFAVSYSTTLKVTLDPEAMASCLTYCQNHQDPTTRSSVIMKTPRRFLCFCA